MIAPSSLKIALTRRLVIGLLLLGVVGTALAVAVSTRFANRAYDRSLFDDVRVLANQVRWAQGTAQITLSPDALLWLLADEGDDVIYRVTNLADGRVLTGNGDLGPLPDAGIDADAPYYRSARVGTEDLRVAYVKHFVGPAGTAALVEIAETTRKRNALSRGILIGTAAMMATFILAAALLVWSGIGTSLAPLKVVEADAARRSIGHLQPLDPGSAPDEVRGLIEAINRMMARVAEGVDMQHHFLANAAHQLKTPIAGLRLQAQLALKNEPSGPTRDSLLEVERRAMHSGHLIEQLLTLARAEASDDALPSTRIDLAHVVRDAIERLMPDAIARSIDLGFASDDAPSVIVANELLVGELVVNLVDNALRYGRANGQVTASLERQGDDVILAVADDGEGLSIEPRERVFQRFWRSDGVSGDGAGLGLAIVKEIAERYGGTVSIASRPEYPGTRIAVRFAPGRPA